MSLLQSYCFFNVFVFPRTDIQPGNATIHDQLGAYMNDVEMSFDEKYCAKVFSGSGGRNSDARVILFPLLVRIHACNDHTMAVMQQRKVGTPQAVFPLSTSFDGTTFLTRISASDAGMPPLLIAMKETAEWKLRSRFIRGTAHERGQVLLEILLNDRRFRGRARADVEAILPPLSDISLAEYEWDVFGDGMLVYDRNVVDPDERAADFEIRDQIFFGFVFV